MVKEIAAAAMNWNQVHLMFYDFQSFSSFYDFWSFLQGYSGVN